MHPILSIGLLERKIKAIEIRCLSDVQFVLILSPLKRLNVLRRC